MFRLPFIAIITLRVIFCPLLCLGCDEGVDSLKFLEAHTCQCCEKDCDGSDHDPCKDDDAPCPPGIPTDCPCDSGCVAKIVPEMFSRAISLDSASVESLWPSALVSLDGPARKALRFERRTHRLDLKDGRSIRLVHASLLL